MQKHPNPRQMDFRVLFKTFLMNLYYHNLIRKERLQ
nr:MAG TPA: hypothetical protein [Caudoviricetes sp.]